MLNAKIMLARISAPGIINAKVFAKPAEVALMRSAKRKSVQKNAPAIIKISSAPSAAAVFIQDVRKPFA